MIMITDQTFLPCRLLRMLKIPCNYVYLIKNNKISLKKNQNIAQKHFHSKVKGKFLFNTIQMVFFCDKSIRKSTWINI